MSGERLVARGIDEKGIPFSVVRDIMGGEGKFQEVGGKNCPLFENDSLAHLSEPIRITQEGRPPIAKPPEKRRRGQNPSHAGMKL